MPSLTKTIKAITYNILLNACDALCFTIPKQLLELSNTSGFGKLVIDDDMCASPQFRLNFKRSSRILVETR